MQSKKRKTFGTVAKGKRSAASHLTSLMGGSKSTGPEYKNKDTLISSSNITDTTTFTLLTAIAEGVGTGQRIAKVITLHNITINYLVTAPSSTKAYTRIILFRDNGGDGVAPTEAELLESTTFAGSLFNALNRSRFTILWDKHFINRVGEQTTTAGAFDKYFFNFRDIPKCRFIGTSDAIGSAGEGSLWLAHLSQQSTETGALSAHIRVRYSDS